MAQLHLLSKRLEKGKGLKRINSSNTYETSAFLRGGLTTKVPVPVLVQQHCPAADAGQRHQLFLQ